MQRILRTRTGALLGVIALVMLVACSKEVGRSAGGAGTPVESVAHIHGLGAGADGTVFVATHGGLIRATPGAKWVYASADRYDHMGFTLHPGAAVMYRSGHAPERPSLGVDRSLIDGATWAHMSDVATPPVDFHAMAVSLADPNTLLGWDSGGRGTFRSTDGGRTWTTPTARGIDARIFVLAGSAQTGVMLAGTETGLYRTTDLGDTWTRVSPEADGYVNAVATDPSDARHVMAFTKRGMKISRDGGATWVPARGGIPSNALIGTLAISSATTAYGADATTVYQTKDDGLTWSVLSPGA